MTSPGRTFEQIVGIVEGLAKGVVAEFAPAVDRDARFPQEAFDAFRREKLLSTFVPTDYGGDGLTISQVAKLCEILGQYCASTAMVYAMHQIQVACITNHRHGSAYFERFLHDLCERQWLLASATTELGVGGDLRSSICHVEISEGRFTLEKKAPVISYALNADAILITCRKDKNAQPHEQVHVVAFTKDCQLEPLSTWDTLGFRGTCSSGYTVKTSGSAEQILPEPFADVLAQSMHPTAHATWGSLWYGIAADAVRKARAAVRAAARKNPEGSQVAMLRLAEVDEQLFSMRSGLYQAIEEYETLLAKGNREAFESYGFSTRTNNVKLRCSEMVVDIVGKALLIVGIMGYKNDSPNSLGRHLRDAYGAALMVNNDRIRGHNAAMQVALREV